MKVKSSSELLVMVRDRMKFCVSTTMMEFDNHEIITPLLRAAIDDEIGRIAIELLEGAERSATHDRKKRATKIILPNIKS